MTLETRRLTYEEYLKLPETKLRYDIVDGEIIFYVSWPYYSASADTSATLSNDGPVRYRTWV